MKAAATPTASAGGVFLVGIVVFLSVFLPEIHAQATENEGMFTSTTDLVRLLATEAELVRALKQYAEIEEVRLNKIKHYIAVYGDIQEKAEIDIEKYVGNPLNSYLLIKKLTSDWKEVKDLMSANPGEGLLSNLTDRRTHEPLRWPSEEDLNGAAVGLTRLQDTYKLATTDLAAGRLDGVSYDSSLTAHDCFELGRQSYNNGDHYHTLLWMKEALRKAEQEELGDETVDRADILEYIAFSWYTQGNLKKALQYTIQLLAVNPNHPRAKGNKLYYEDSLAASQGDTGHKKGDDGTDALIDHDVSASEQIKPDDPSEEHVTYQKLCRGEILNKSKFNLQCRYYHGIHPYLTIAPYKEEEVHPDPRIVIYHDVISKSEIHKVRSLATPRFKRATVQNYKTGDLETASYRISKTAWIKREEDEDINNIYTRVHDITGLNMETSEELQVSNYGIGGHYEPHFDFARREEENAFASLGTGNRIATWLFYVSDVDQGGATVFTTLGLTLRPIKGAAVFWYNLYRNGEGDVRTRHAACPVLAGTKWVSNFWIHERGQEFARPCSTSPAK